MKLKIKITFITLIISCLIILSIIAFNSINSDNKKSTSDEDNISISYRYEGGWSPYVYTEVNITGNIAVISIKYWPSEEVVKQRILPEDFINDLISLYQKMDFFNMTINDNTNVMDVGITTISFSFNEQNRTISYMLVENENLTELVSMYWKIISQEEYLYQLTDYQNKDNSTMVGLLSGLSADIRNNYILDTDEFIPIFKNMIEDIDHWDDYEYWVLDCLSEIRGEGFDGDFDLALKWIEDNY